MCYMVLVIVDAGGKEGLRQRIKNIRISYRKQKILSVNK